MGDKINPANASVGISLPPLSDGLYIAYVIYHWFQGFRPSSYYAFKVFFQACIAY